MNPFFRFICPMAAGWFLGLASTAILDNDHAALFGFGAFAALVSMLIGRDK